MNLDINVTVLVGQFILAAILVWVSLRKAPSEKMNLDGSAAEAFANAAKIKAEENAKLETEIAELETRLEMVERKKYRVVMEFTIGDPPEIGKITIEPMIPPPDDAIPTKERTARIKEQAQKHQKRV
jgi:hypothetical protein